MACHSATCAVEALRFGQYAKAILCLAPVLSILRRLLELVWRRTLSASPPCKMMHRMMFSCRLVSRSACVSFQEQLRSCTNQ